LEIHPIGFEVQILFMTADGTYKTLEGAHTGDLTTESARKIHMRNLLIAMTFVLWSVSGSHGGTAQLAAQASGIEAVNWFQGTGSSRIVFENAQHDFPQRIGYERKGASLLAWIEGAQNGKPRHIEFPYVRVSCGVA